MKQTSKWVILYQVPIWQWENWDLVPIHWHTLGKWRHKDLNPRSYALSAVGSPAKMIHFLQLLQYTNKNIESELTSRFQGGGICPIATRTFIRWHHNIETLASQEGSIAEDWENLSSPGSGSEDTRWCLLYPKVLIDKVAQWSHSGGER